MPRNTSSLPALQKALSMELAASQQYLLHAHVLEDWGLGKLAATMREEMHEELGHAGQFIDRILFLGGNPEMVPAKTPVRAQSLKERFEVDRADEAEAIEVYSTAAAEAGTANDIGSRCCSKPSRWTKRATGAGWINSSTCWTGLARRCSCRPILAQHPPPKPDVTRPIRPGACSLTDPPRAPYPARDATGWPGAACSPPRGRFPANERTF